MPPNASDIITYIGVPLAVLGILPILYTAISSLWTIRNIQRKLRANGFGEAITRGSLMSGIVEVSIPCYCITPLDRQEDAKDYWTLNPKPSGLKGGTWTIFHWNCLRTGSKLYRLQFSDELQVPQAEIDFEELLVFLMDRGAVPDIKGLHMLRVSGLWTPTGTSLMLSPSTTESVLRVVMPDDSDGILSLSLQWREAWRESDPTVLPPGWMRLRFPESLIEGNQVLESAPLADWKERSERMSPSLRPMSIRFHFGHEGSLPTIAGAVWEHEDSPLSSYASFTCLAQRESVPCGVLVMLGILNEDDAPPWETKYDPTEKLYQMNNSAMARDRAIRAESLMSQDQAYEARANRQIVEREQLMEELHLERQRDRERTLLRKREAIASPRLETGGIANAARTWLTSQQSSSRDRSLADIVEHLLIDLVLDNPQALNVCVILERWREWNDRGGMTSTDLEVVQKDAVAFCNAACVMGLMKEVSVKEESSVAVDMRECVQHWRKIRLG